MKRKKKMNRNHHQAKEIEESPPEGITPTISSHPLAGISTQTLKIEDYIYKKRGNSVD